MLRLRRREMRSVKDLEKIKQVISHLTSVGDAGEALKLKESYSREISGLATFVQHKQKRIEDLKKDLRDLELLSGAELGDVRQEDKLIEMIKQKARHVNKKAAKHMEKAEEIGRRAYALVQNKLSLYEQLRREIAEFEALEKQCIEEIQAVIRDMHDSNYPAALTAINQAIASENKSTGLIQNIQRSFTGPVRQLEQKLRAIDREIQMFLR